MKGRDNAGQDFRLNDSVIIYNLDFCNSVTSPIEYTDKNGNPATAYKFDAIKKLFELQKQLSLEKQKFILFLTLRNNYKGPELQSFLENPGNDELKILINTYHSLANNDRRSRIVRCFVVSHLSSFFTSHDFTPIFLPILEYTGGGKQGHQLLHFAVAGIKLNKGAGSVPWYQNTQEICKQKFVEVSDSDFILKTCEAVNEQDVAVNPVNILSSSVAFTRHWQG